MEKVILNYPHEGAVAQIKLNAPKANIVDGAMMAELRHCFAEFKQNKDLKIITIEGEGSHFSFGASVEEHRREYAAEMLKDFHQMFYDMMDLAIPTLARVSGNCLGGGLELALMCNFIFADQSAKFGQPEIMLGVFAPPASILLPAKLGQAKADELLITGKTIKADQAQQWGLVNKIYENHQQLAEGVDKFIEKHILPKSASSLKFAVRAARKSFYDSMQKQLQELERMYVDELMSTKDANEGINSFIERRKPQWVNE